MTTYDAAVSAAYKPTLAEAVYDTTLPVYKRLQDAVSSVSGILERFVSEEDSSFEVPSIMAMAKRDKNGGNHGKPITKEEIKARKLKKKLKNGGAVESGPSRVRNHGRRHN